MFICLTILNCVLLDFYSFWATGCMDLVQLINSTRGWSTISDNPLMTLVVLEICPCSVVERNYSLGWESTIVFDSTFAQTTCPVPVHG